MIDQLIQLISFASLHFMQTGTALSLTTFIFNYAVLLPGFVFNMYCEYFNLLWYAPW